jgi:molybdopterin converting factor subunit 1
MRVTVRLFARLRDLAGAGELVRDVPDSATVHTVWALLTKETPSLSQYERTMSVAVNAEYARMTAVLSDGDEVAFMPPVSGG